MKIILLTLALTALASAQGWTVCRADPTTKAAMLNANKQPVCFVVTPAAVNAMGDFRTATASTDPATKVVTYAYPSPWRVLVALLEGKLEELIDRYPPVAVVTAQKAATDATAAKAAAVKAAAATSTTETP